VTSTTTGNEGAMVVWACDFDVACAGVRYGGQWMRVKGASPSSNTGPQADHSSGQGGRTMSSPQKSQGIVHV
jgi:hypothetical protein